MNRLSSSITLILKLFFPIFWIVFFGSFTMAFVLYDGYNQMFSSTIFKIGVVLFFLTGIGLLYISFWQLRRVEVDDSFFYVTDYFKTIRIPFSFVSKISENNWLLFSTLTIKLNQKGHFGKKIHFIQSKKNVDNFLRNRLDLHPYFEGKES